MTPIMVPGYRHVPGNHCGSTALRNLLAFHGLEMSEEMALGLGAGISFFYVVLEGSSPSRFTNGRTGRLEEQFVDLTDAPLRLETFDDSGDAWRAAAADRESSHRDIRRSCRFHAAACRHRPGSESHRAG